ncbi:MAG: CoA pyrophosphatase [Magnetococcales bacterium]|nr:CoA pyrophosphatase [Magnetococcales bacterium]MBF0171882.1 CoA pyrophosphatase [Magnetococcales bacterium]MBF0632283.1 CoA pyrophosphatase [Magnetococcales bacterium]
MIFPSQAQADEGCRILFIRRSNQVRHHKGQIAFPGGRRDHEDTTILHTALRETVEELGPQARPLRVLGMLPPVATVVTGFIIYPFVGMMPDSMEVQPEPREVDGVLTVPFNFFLAEGRCAPERYHYGSNVIWGATARIINQLVAFMQRGHCA